MYRRIWIVRMEHRGFEGLILVYGSEDELRAYVTSELGYMPGYTGARDDEVEALRKMRVKVYLAPEVKR